MFATVKIITAIILVFMKYLKNKKLLNSLRKYRRARGLRQKDVARILGISSTTLISRWENGQCFPKLENLFKLAVLYRTMVDTLFVDMRRVLKEEIITAEEELLKGKR